MRAAYGLRWLLVMLGAFGAYGLTVAPWESVLAVVVVAGVPLIFIVWDAQRFRDGLS